jgi:hypothetical protein
VPVSCARLLMAEGPERRNHGDTIVLVRSADSR